MKLLGMYSHLNSTDGTTACLKYGSFGSLGLENSGLWNFRYLPMIWSIEKIERIIFQADFIADFGD